MQIIFESRDADGAQMRDLSVDRVRFVLRRLKALVPRAKVHFSDVNGPRGGVDKRCQVELSTEAVGTVVISSLARDWRTALDRSLRRASRVLTRSLQRNQKTVRGRPAKLKSVNIESVHE
ncbi:MAG: HPF/RaiA family ribosome-associated protein [Aquabacterium sp.]|nr:HPF/RaiA family ribosome-associated protein [Aquabacterium sp.]